MSTWVSAHLCADIIEDGWLVDYALKAVMLGLSLDERRANCTRWRYSEYYLLYLLLKGDASDRYSVTERRVDTGQASFGARWLSCSITICVSIAILEPSSLCLCTSN